MDALEFKRALRKLEEEYNIVKPALVLAEANQEFFLPELPTKSYAELREIAREYQVLPLQGKITKATLVTLLTESINNRLEYTKNEYTRVCAELKQLWVTYAQKPRVEMAEESKTSPTQLWLLLESSLPE